MEYAIGRVCETKEQGARIRVLFRQENNFWTQNSIQEIFPPDGYVFAPDCKVYSQLNVPLLKSNTRVHDLKGCDRLFEPLSLKAGTLVRFSYVPKEDQSINYRTKDQYIVQKKNCEVMIRPLIKILNIEMQKIYNREQVTNSDEEVFFIKKQESISYLCGPLNGKDLSPGKGKEVGAWPYIPNKNTIDYNGQTYLVTDIKVFTRKKPAFMVDCMSTEQLYNDWFRKQFNVLGSHHVFEHIHQQLKEIESNASDVLAKERFQRIFRTLDFLNLSYEEIKHLSEIPEFQKIYETAVDKNIAAILKEEKFLSKQKMIEEKYSEMSKKVEDQLAKKKVECQKCISELESELESQLVQKEREYHNRLSKLENQLVQKEREYHNRLSELKTLLTTKEQQYSKRTAELNEKIARLEEACASKEESLELLKKNKREFVEMIRLQADLVGKVESGTGSLSHSWQYPLEVIAHDPDAQPVKNDADKQTFCARIQELYRKENMREALNRLRYPALQTEDIRNGIFLATMLGNSVYELCQPSPKWLTFEDFWGESLQPIWDSAHRSPEIWHFLLIENFNLALPECWGRPLWNLFDEYITLLPCAQNAQLPENLRVIVSLAPTQSDDHSHFGLPTQIGLSWPKLSIGPNWEDWFNFASDKYQGLAINEEFYYPVSKKL